MLTAHANTTPKDFIAQLRTYVIALGLSQQVVDCVDSLTGVDDFETEYETDLADAEVQGRTDMKTQILEAVDAWLEDKPTLAPLQKSLLDAIRAV